MADIYIAAPWIHRHVAKSAAAEFRCAGHRITEPWWDHEDVPITDAAHDELESQARADVHGVLTADVLVLLNLSKSEGKAVEQGIALQQGIPIVGVGERGSNIFQHMDAYTWVATVEDAVQVVEKLCRA